MRARQTARRSASLGALALVAAGCPSGPSPASDPLDALARGEVEVVDCTWPLGPGIPTWPGLPEPTIAKSADRDSDGHYANQLAFPEHTGTHVDAPAYYVADTATIDVIPAADLVAPLCVIDLSERAALDPDTRCTRADVEAFEAKHGPIPEGAIVCLHTGWAARWHVPADFLNTDAAGVMHFPSFAPDAATYCVANRNVRGLGIDTISLDFGGAQDAQVHQILHSAGRYGIESLRNLDALPPTGAVLVVAPLPIVGGSGAPGRILALVPRGAGLRPALRGDPRRLDAPAPPAGGAAPSRP